MLQIGFILVRALPREKKAKENKKECVRKSKRERGGEAGAGREGRHGRERYGEGEKATVVLLLLPEFYYCSQYRLTREVVVVF